MNLNDLLETQDIDPKQVIVMRHRPFEPELNKVLPWLAAERPDVFNAYQQTQGARPEKVMHGMQGTGYVASFIGHEAGKAEFVGLYEIGVSRPLTHKQYWQVPAYIEMKAFGMRGFADSDPRPSVLWFDLTLTDFCAGWKGKLIVGCRYQPPSITSDVGDCYGPATIAAAVYEGHRYARDLDATIDPDGVPFKTVKHDLELGG